MNRLSSESIADEVAVSSRDCGAKKKGRVLGSVDQGLEGPTLVVLGGIHGNEPGGPRAIARVLDTLQTLDIPFRGRLVGLRGNLPALEKKKRFITRDLNRHWDEASLEALSCVPPTTLDGEDLEQRELLELLLRIQEESPAPLLCLDFHSTSGDGPPFCFLTSQDAACGRLARSLMLPVILGVEDVLEGTLIGYLNSRGAVALGLEGGQHDDPSTVTHLECALWLALVHWRMLRRKDVPHLEELRKILFGTVSRLPQVARVVHRHALGDGDDFKMVPGYANFDRVAANEKVAQDSRGEVITPVEGRILLPLYQGLGEEGFLVVRRVPSFWHRLRRGIERLFLRR